MQKIYLFVMLLCFSLTTFAQNNQQEKAVEEVFIQNNTPLLAAEGTFVFQKTGKTQEVFTTERYEEIRALVAVSRDMEEEVTLEISSLTTVRIPSELEITNPQFTPFSQLFEE